MSENDTIEEIIEEVKEPITKRGRPRKVELPETTLDTIESIEEVKEPEKEEVKGNNTSNKEIPESVAKIKPEHKNNKQYTISYSHKVGDDVYLAYFSSGEDGALFGSIIEKYRFRPFKTKVKEVLINSDNTILYRLDSCQGCFKEALVVDTQEECKRICDTLNVR